MQINIHGNFGFSMQCAFRFWVRSSYGMHKWTVRRMYGLEEDKAFA